MPGNPIFRRRGARAASHVAMRSALRQQMYGSQDLPTTLPSSVDLSYGGLSARSSWPSDISRVDRLVCPTVLTAVQHSHLCYPAVAPAERPSGARNRLVIHVGGHSAAGHYYASTGQANLTYRLVRQGFHVLGCCMPETGFNAGGVESYAPHTTTNHDYDEVEAVGEHGLRVFVDGIIVALNYIQANFSFLTIDAVGLSGGGWIVTMLAALDPRVRKSISVFGSLPHYLRSPDGPGDAGDWEQLLARQWWGPLRGSEENAYVMGCADPGRRRVQVLGTTEGVFPVATVLDDVREFATRVSGRVPSGQHEVVIDATTSSHDISDATRVRIIDECIGIDPTWTPARLGSRVKSWLKASAGITVNGSNHVTAWVDQAPSPPTWSVNGTPDYEATGGPSSGPCVSFLAAATEYATSSSVNAGTAMQAVIVGKRGSDPASGAPDLGGLWKHGAADLIHVPFTDGNVFDGFGSTARKDALSTNPSDSFASWFVYEARSSATEWSSVLNGTPLVSTGTSTVSTSAAIRLAAGQYGTPSVLGNVRIAEFILFGDGVLSEWEAENLRAYINRTHGLTIRL